MLRFAFLAAILAASAQAATIRGVVLDYYTGRPLARSLVTIEMVQPGGVTKTSVRTSSAGQFVFFPLSAGVYLVTASRPNFMTLKYGQKFWNAPGVPLILAEDSAPFLDLRLRRPGAISGTVVDENEVGIGEQEVYVYRNSRPPKLINRAETDDRGSYRLSGLDPGQYLVRAGPKQLDEEVSVIPTFHKGAARVEDAQLIDVDLDQQLTDVNIRPNFGKLFRLSVTALASYPCSAVRVTLFSDMGQTTRTDPFNFADLAPGAYELLAECSDQRYPKAVFQRLTIDRDTQMQVVLNALPTIQLSLVEREGRAFDGRSVSVFARRRTLAGEGPAQLLRSGMYLSPGRYEMMATTSGDLYPVSIFLQFSENRDSSRADNWSEFMIGRGNSMVRTTVAIGAGAIEGRVTKSLSDPAAGAPVYLEAYDPAGRKRLADLRKTLTDARGQYRFTGLAPGSYRVVSSFEFDDPDETMMKFARARAVSIAESASSHQDLDLYSRQ